MTEPLPLRRAAILSVAMLLSCTPAPVGPPRAPPEAPLGAPACPLGVEGAKVTATDTNDGIAVTFTSDEQHLEELRQRARHAAAMHGPLARQGMGHEGRHKSGAHHGLQSFRLHDVRATTTDIAGGVQIVFVPDNPADRDALQSELRERVAKISRAACQH